MQGAYIVINIVERKCCIVELRKIAAKPTAWLGGLAVFLLLMLSVEDYKFTGSSLGKAAKQAMAQEFAASLYSNFLPSFSFVQEKSSKHNWFTDAQLANIIPLYGYSQKQRNRERMEERESLDEIVLAEAREEPVEQDELSLEELLLAENEAALAGQVDGNNENSINGEGSSTGNDGTGQPVLNPVENDMMPGVFTPHAMQYTLDLEVLKNYETLVKQFYTIDANTMAGSELLDAEKLLAPDMTISKDGTGPQILIYHTHSQETYADSIPGDETTSIVGVGERLAQILREQYGYQVLHHTKEYDVEIRDDAYANSLPAIEQVLADNPTIEVVIDLHRDEMPEEKKLLIDIDGRPTARFMFFNGLSRTKKTGDISYLYNENLGQNLAFSFQMQKTALEYYPGLTRKIYLKGYRYNMHLKPRTLLVELGAQNNTVEEAMNACDPLAHILDLVLSKN